MNEVDKALRAKRDPFVAQLASMAEVMFPYDRIYGRILGGYSDEQRQAFYRVCATHAGMRYHGETSAESALRRVELPQGAIEETTEGKARLLRSLHRAGVQDINLGMIATAAGVLLDVYHANQRKP